MAGTKYLAIRIAFALFGGAFYAGVFALLLFILHNFGLTAANLNSNIARMALGFSFLAGAFQGYRTLKR